jgi:hypothetical protein
MSDLGRKGFGEASTPSDQEKDPLIKRETLELVRADYRIREARVRKRIFDMVKAVGAASHAEVVGGSTGGSCCAADRLSGFGRLGNSTAQLENSN